MPLIKSKWIEGVGEANGIAPLNSSGLINSSFLPGFVDDVLEYSDLASFPSPGETGKLYIALDTNLVYRWSGSTYVLIASGDVPTANEITYSQANEADWTVPDESSVKETLDEVGSRLSTLEAAPQGYTPINESITITPTDITNGFVTLSQVPVSGVVSVTPVNGPLQHPGVDYNISNDQLQFLGDLTTILSAGDILIVSYMY